MMHLLLLEDEDLVAKHVAAILRDAFPDMLLDREVTVEGAVAAALATAYDCLILDRRVQDGDGLDGLALLRTRGIETPAVILSSLNAVQDRVLGLEYGADDYLDKNFAPQELIARVRAAVRRGQTQGHPRILKFHDLELHRAAEVAEWQGIRLKLKPKEFRMLLCLVEAFPSPVSYESMWRAAWPEWHNLSPQKSPIHTTMSRLREGLALVDQLSIQSGSDGYALRVQPAESGV